MNENEYQKLHDFEQFYWWHVGRRDIFESILSRFLRGQDNKILEVGCGTGGNLDLLSRFGKVTGLDSSPEAMGFCRQRGFGNLVLGKAEDTRLPDASFDVVVAFDVLEHVQDDEQALRECFRLLKDGGYALFTVPAYQFLWSEHDEALGHLRRYEAVEFSQTIRKAGFRIVKISYAITFLFPVIAAYRMVRNLMYPNSRKNTAYIALPKILNTFFIFALKGETFLLRYANFPFGTSIICLAQKNPLGQTHERNS